MNRTANDSMASLLFLAHRLPYPPNKGDKVRSYHLLRHLAERHRVFVGTFVDDADDEPHVPTLAGLVAGLHAERLHPKPAKLASLAGLATGEALTLRYYRSAALARWAERTAREQGVEAVVVFSSSMAPIAERLGLPLLLDFVDVDSAKWTDYAPNHRWPLSALYRREGKKLLAYERAACARAARSFFATAQESALFERLAPECAGRVDAMDNGVDARFFSPEPGRASPYATGERPVVFTGAMDYWPNIDAVTWFAREVLPAVRARHPAVRFHIVGRSPVPAVQALAAADVNVTGTVPDVRPWLQHAEVVVAPLRLARGIQNKVLEAMAMGRPVVASATCAAPLNAAPGRELLAAADADALAREVIGVLDDPARASAIGAAGRAAVVDRYSWPAHLAVIDRALESVLAARPVGVVSAGSPAEVAA